MGATHSYRYVNTNSVPNSNSGTYTYASGSTGGTVDMGSTNTYRYVNASNVYSKGKADGDIKHGIEVYARDWDTFKNIWLAVKIDGVTVYEETKSDPGYQTTI